MVDLAILVHKEGRLQKIIVDSDEIKRWKEYHEERE